MGGDSKGRGGRLRPDSFFFVFFFNFIYFCTLNFCYHCHSVLAFFFCFLLDWIVSSSHKHSGYKLFRIHTIVCREADPQAMPETWSLPDHESLSFRA